MVFGRPMFGLRQPTRTSLPMCMNSKLPSCESWKHKQEVAVSNIEVNLGSCYLGVKKNES